VKVMDVPVGRLVFAVEEGNLERSLENFKALVTGGRRALDPALSYIGCEFAYGPQYVLQRSGGNAGSYKWAHVCKGRGKNIFGKGAMKETDLMACRHECPGYDRGSYYYGIDCSDPRDGGPEESTQVQQVIELDVLKPLGLVLEEEEEGGAGVVVADCVEGGNAWRSGKVLRGDKILALSDTDVSAASFDDVMAKMGTFASSVRLRLGRSVQVPAGQGNTVLALPMGGPGAGQSRFDIIRVGESPSTWGLRLLVNSAVIGRMESGQEVLASIAAGRGPACIVDCGVLD